MPSQVYEKILSLHNFNSDLSEIELLINFCHIDELAAQFGRLCPTLLKSLWIYLN